MTKIECERAIRALIHQWAEQQHPGEDKGQLYDFEFIGWVRETHPELLNFRSRMPVVDVVEQWFAQETKQTWRN